MMLEVNLEPVPEEVKPPAPEQQQITTGEKIEEPKPKNPEEVKSGVLDPKVESLPEKHENLDSDVAKNKSTAVASIP